MKKTIMNIRTMAALLIASAAFTACSNEDGAVIGEQPAATQTPQVYTLTLQAANATGAQHRALELDGTKLVAKWAAGDQLTVINVTSMTPLGGTLTASNVSADGKTCTFSGTLTGAIAVDDQLALHYHATSGTQDGTLESAAANDQANAIVKVASVDEGNITILGGTATFTTTTAMLKLTLKDGSANALNATSLKMTVDGTDFFTASPTAATYTANGDGVLYFAVPSKDNAAAIIAQEKSGNPPAPALIETWKTNLNTYDVTFTATVGSDTYTATKTGYKLAAGKYYATELTMAKFIDPNLLSGVFSVSSTKTVKFSKGNLRYASGTWSFFDNQYDYYTSYSADAWDKFGWSTSATTYGMNTSEDTSDYSGDFVDWGATMGTGWFTLSSAEWTYLFNTRSASYGRYAKAKVNNVQGVILFPDTYTHPDGVTAPTGVNATNDTGWNGNNYSSADWTKMESAGCVFLPAAGKRQGSSVSNSGEVGGYWSATPAGYFAYRLDFWSGLVTTATSSSSRDYGYSVRLVREVTE